MRHAEFSIAPMQPLASTAATRPTQALGGNSSGGGFGQLFGDLQGEVADFITHGGGAASAGQALSPAGAMLRARGQDLSSVATEDGATAPAQQEFLESIAPWAREAGQRLGVAPELVSAHAALESGWGQRPLRQADGSSSHNLFGMKAGASWQGDVNESATTEYLHGAAVKTSERFRSYPDQASAFRDYAQQLLDNPRYHAAIGAGSNARAFAEGLARGGYATDPNYAEKLTKLASKLQGVKG